MCDRVLVTLLKLQPYRSQSTRELHATPSSDTTPINLSLKIILSPGSYLLE